MTVTVMRRYLGVGALILILMIVAVYFFFVRPLRIAGDQLQNYATMQFYMSCLDQYQKQHGQYPPELAAALDFHFAQYPRPDEERWYRSEDIWGNAYRYETDGAHYIFASYGADGHPDDGSVFPLGAAPAGDKRPCYDRRLDTIVTDLGVHQACSK